MKNIFSAFRAGAAVLAAGIAFTACNKSNDAGSEDTNVAAVMAFNLSTDVSAAGFSLSGNNITGTPLGFNNYTGTYRLIYPGNRSVESFSFNSGNTLATTSSYLFAPQQYYSVFLVGTEGNFENVVVQDKLDSLSGAGKSFLRYINAIPGASGLNVTISSNGANLVNDNAAYKSVSEFVAADPGQVTVTVSNGGNINVTRTLTLEQRGIYTVLLSGKPGAAGDAAVQIKFVQNGKIDETAGNRSASGSNRAVN